MVWKACLACLLKACLACLEGLSSWLEGWCWLGGRLAVESHTHDALGRSADYVIPKMLIVVAFVYGLMLQFCKFLFRFLTGLG